MSEQNRIRRQQCLREAEGYLDLILCLAHRWPLDAPARDRLARRAIAALDHLDAKERHRPESLFLRGQALLVMRQFEQAVEPLREAASLDENDVRAWLALGACHKSLDRIDLAIQTLEQAAAIDSSCSVVQYNLACYWAVAGKVEPAVRHLCRAIDLNSSFRDRAANDPDFESIHRDPLFRAATSVVV